MSTKLLELIKTRKNSPRGKHSVISYQLSATSQRRSLCHARYLRCLSATRTLLEVLMGVRPSVEACATLHQTAFE
ncbi:hypothetical protein [Moorena sp. SIO4G3]|uniref:hypothetical protein n=1 Tax=Moorena sp. SIO4G3 TaxID=2607821 RepID=UPI00142B8488|nr:hypothetical protein [Moorena sp. SIO4G3]NEO77963.1 hypothetical protein [Moorena sp. SIO4G3]